MENTIKVGCMSKIGIGALNPTAKLNIYGDVKETETLKIVSIPYPDACIGTSYKIENNDTELIFTTEGNIGIGV